MLVEIGRDFGVADEIVSRVPTLAQAGYGCGIVLISPLGDLVRRRQLVLLLFTLCTVLSIALARATSVEMLEGISFVVGVLTVRPSSCCSSPEAHTSQVSPQICIPWTADLAPSNIRAKSMSITLSGLITGLVLGRVLAGIFAQFTSWRDTYWFAVAIQGGESWLNCRTTSCA